MTSKNLYFNLFRENLKRRIWPATISMITFFFGLPIATSMVLSNAKGREISYFSINYPDIMELIVGKYSITLFIITCIFAVIFAIQGFGYLFSKNKVDLYHSMPVKRERLFIAIFINGILVYIIPYCINLLISYMITAFYGIISPQIVAIGLSTMVFNLVFYFLIYSTIVLAVMLTGNMIVSLLGSAVFLFYGPFFNMIMIGYVQTYFSSYNYQNNGGVINKYLSPLFAYIFSVYSDSAQFAIWSMLVAFAAGIVFVIISMILYKKRPSEMAGKSMVFQRTKPIFKILLMIPLALGTGLFFKSVSYGSENTVGDGWLVFGAIVGILMSHCIIEVIYEFDLKAVKYNLKQILLPMAVSAVIICIYRFDMIGYDSYLPEKEKIASVSIKLGYESGNYFEMDENNKISHFDKEDYIIRNMKLTDMEIVYPVLEAGIKTNRKNKNNGNSGFEDSMSVRYELKNGKEVFRNYSLDLDEYGYEINSLYKSKEYKDGNYLIYSFSDEELSTMPFRWTQRDNRIDTEDKYVAIYEGDAYITDEKLDLLDISKEEKEELLKVYKEELYALDYNERLEGENIHILGTLEIIVMGLDNEKRPDYRTISVDILYPEFEKTIELINSYTDK